MALGDLQSVIEKLREIIESHHSYLSGHETRTRQVVIDRLLNALGWNTSDPNKVELEYSAGGGRADYALKSNGQVVAVLEAKALSRPLEQKELEQVLQYAVGRGIPYMAVTNGDEWRMYDVFEAKPIEEKVIMRFRLTGMSSHEIALKSLCMWNPNLASDSVPIMGPDPVLVSLNQKIAPIENAESKDSSGEMHKGPNLDPQNGWVKLDEQIDTTKGAQKPYEMAFPNGSRVKIKTWVALWVETAEWVVESRSISDEFRFGKNKQMVVKSDAEGLWVPYQLKNGLWIERNLNPGNVLLTTRRLLEHFEIKAGSISLKFDVD
ncbi:MAG: hypothetical protein F4X40_08345 [Chloroflexi bacterium]|nr:hypothetical protein [Chloroflexota bacterium]